VSIPDRVSITSLIKRKSADSQFVIYFTYYIENIFYAKEIVSSIAVKAVYQFICTGQHQSKGSYIL
jgi:hypothetical protein